MKPSVEGPQRRENSDPLEHLNIPSQPVEPDSLKRELEQADRKLKPFRTPVTEEVLNSIIG